ncbi:hypothetical protein GCM10027037_03050 [Mucilaginibacter koreensis]
MKKNYTLLLFLLLSLMGTTHVYAGWPVGKKRYLVGTSFYTYFSSNYWDRKGNFHNDNTSKFSAYSVGIFADYGLTRKLDLLVNLPVSYQYLKQPGSSLTNIGSGDLQIGLNYVLKSFNLKNYITGYAGAIIPTYAQKLNQTLGYAYYGSEFRLSNTGNIKLGSHTGYYNVDADYRKYFADDGPSQFNYMGTFGYFLNKYNQVLVDVAGTISASPTKIFNNYAGSTLDYRNVRVQLDYGYTVNRRVSVYASGFYTVSGFNIGQAYGGSLQLLMRL